MFMKICCWNCRGIRGCSKYRVVRKLLVENKINFSSFIETKHSSVSIEKIRKWWGHMDVEWCDVNIGESGEGLICSWEKDLIKECRDQKGNRWICMEGFFS